MPLAARSGEGLLTEPTADARLSRRELRFLVDDAGEAAHPTTLGSVFSTSTRSAMSSKSVPSKITGVAQRREAGKPMVPIAYGARHMGDAC